MRRQICGLALFTFLSLPSLFASTITNGTFAIAGTLFVTNFTTSSVTTPAGTCPASLGGSACIFWEDSAGATVGKVDISSTGLPNGDIPASISGNDAANISSLQTPPDIVDASGFPATPFISFNNGGVTTQLLINFIDAGIYSSAACGSAPVSGQQCTLPGSLFNFVNNPPPKAGNPCGTDGCEATATWVFEGVTNDSNSTWVGNFSSQFPLGTTYQAVFAKLASQGYVSDTFSGTITLTSAVPEPGTFGIMIGAGLIGLSALIRRRRAIR